VVTILARHSIGHALANRLSQLERSTRVLQGIAGVGIIVIGLVTLAQVRL
jgi:cytochrome c biogenesis protein CcdA